MKIPIIDQYGQCWHSAFCERGDNLALGRRRLLIVALASSLSATITDGTVFTTLLLLLLKEAETDVNIFYMTLIPAIGTFGIVFQLLSPVIFGNLTRRKPLILIFRGLSLTLNILLPAVLLIPGDVKMRAGIFAGFILVKAFCTGVGTPAQTDFTLGNIPGDIRSDYYTMLSALSNLINGLFGLAVSVMMDRFAANEKLFLGTVAIRGFTLLLAGIELMFLSKVKERPYPETKRLTFRDMFLSPFRNREFMIPVTVWAVMSFSAGFPGSFYSAHLLDNAKISYTYISLITIAAIPCAFISMPFWNRMIHRIGWYRVMAVSGFLYATCHLINIFVTRDSQFMYIISGVYCQLVCQGYCLFSSNLPFLRLPKENRNGCLALFSVIGALCQTASTALGGVFIKLTTGYDWHVFGLTIENRSYICGVTFLGYCTAICLCLFAYRRDKKRGIAPTYMND